VLVLNRRLLGSRCRTGGAANGKRSPFPRDAQMKLNSSAVHSLLPLLPLSSGRARKSNGDTCESVARTRNPSGPTAGPINCLNGDFVFDESRGLALMRRAARVLTVHGEETKLEGVYLGGLDTRLKTSLRTILEGAGYVAREHWNRKRPTSRPLSSTRSSAKRLTRMRNDAPVCHSSALPQPNASQHGLLCINNSSAAFGKAENARHHALVKRG
jgi:hypothetical protein